MDIDKATLLELQSECICNDELYDFISSVNENAEDFIENLGLEELRIFIGDWVINNSEC